MGVRRGRDASTTPPAPDAGMVTAEAALVLPVLVVVALVALAGVEVAVVQTRCLQAAALAARLSARGEPPTAVAAAMRLTAPADARLTVGTDGGIVDATVSVAVRLPVVGAVLPRVVVRAGAAAAQEPA